MDKPKQVIFVVGSNRAGRHGKGAALYALRNHGAIYGKGMGIQGDSYAIPTKSYDIKTLPIDTIEVYIEDFILFATNNGDLEFNVTRIGCGLAGYKDKEIAPMFKESPDNVILPKGWRELGGSIIKVTRGYCQHNCFKIEDKHECTIENNNSGDMCFCCPDRQSDCEQSI